MLKILKEWRGTPFWFRHLENGSYIYGKAVYIVLKKHTLCIHISCTNIHTSCNVGADSRAENMKWNVHPKCCLNYRELHTHIKDSVNFLMFVSSKCSHLPHGKLGTAMVNVLTKTVKNPLFRKNIPCWKKSLGYTCVVSHVTNPVHTSRLAWKRTFKKKLLVGVLALYSNY